jgi:hypothetical protein
MDNQNNGKMATNDNRSRVWVPASPLIDVWGFCYLALIPTKMDAA